MPALVFISYLVVEIVAFAALAQWLGVASAILVLIACSAAGMLLLGSQWRRVLDQFRQVGQGEVTAGTAVADGALVVVGAGLMFVPGVVTSVFGVLLLLPPTRGLVRPLVGVLAARRVHRVGTTMPHRGVVIDADDVVDGTVESEWYDDPKPTNRQIIDM